MPLPLILNQTLYVDDLIEQLNHPDTAEVWVQAMVFSPRTDKLKALIEALLGLLQRGGKATIITDYYNHVQPEDHKLNNYSHDVFYLQEVKNIFTAYRETRKEFMAAGGQWIETNRAPLKTKIIASWNRNHMKSAGVVRSTGKRFTYFGGCNIYPHAMEFMDFMVRFDDPVIYEKIRVVIDEVVANKPIPDARIPCTPDYTIYIDGGRFPGKSIIMKTAYQLIKEAGVTSIYITSQFPTDPILQGILEKLAKHGVAVHLFIPVDTTDVLSEGVGEWLYQRMLAAEKNISDYHLYHSAERKVHAKLLITENKSGEIKAFWGSNNYFIVGPLLMTPEIQMLSVNQELNHLLKDFFWGMVHEAMGEL